MNWKALVILLLTLTLTVSTALAYSGFPSAYYPGNQFGHGARFYPGPWGEFMVYGGHGYYPNWYGRPPYGFRTYGCPYTIWQLRYGQTSHQC